MTWRNTGRSLVGRLGGALFLLVGYPSIFIAYWLPWALRLPHLLEVLADSVVYACALAGLLGSHGTIAWRRPAASGRLDGPVQR